MPLSTLNPLDAFRGSQLAAWETGPGSALHRLDAALDALSQVNADQLSPAEREQLRQCLRRVVRQCEKDAIADAQVLRAAQSLPELVPDLLEAGGNPNAVLVRNHGQLPLICLMAESATALQDCYGSKAYDFFEAAMARTSAPFPMATESGMDFSLLADLYAQADQNPWLLGIIQQGLEKSGADEATGLLMAMANRLHPTLAKLALERGADLTASVLLGQDRRVALLDALLASPDRHGASFIAAWVAEHQAQALQEGTPAVQAGPGRRM